VGNIAAMASTVHAELLARAARIIGGKAALRAYLRVPMGELDRWLGGEQRAPTAVFLRAVDLVETLRPAHEARQLEVCRIGEEAVGAALKAGRGTRGNVQLAYPEALAIIGHQGFARPFLDFFAVVPHERGETSACGAAMARGRRVVVPDVAADPIFAGTRAGEILLEAGIQAVQSTPIVSSDGRVIGMLSTHYESTGEPPEADLAAYAAIAGNAAARLEEHLS